MTARTERALRLAVGVVVLGYVARVAWIAGGDGLARYPFVHADSWDWLANALRWTGVPVRSTWRAPLNPLSYAALYATGLEDLIPWLPPLWFAVLLVGILTVGWAAIGPAAAAGALLVASNHLLLGHALTIGSDVLSAGLGLLGVLALCVAVERRDGRWLYGAAVGLMLGFLTQPSTPFLAPALLAILLYDPRGRFLVGTDALRWLLRRPEAYAAAALALAMLALVPILRRVLVGMWFAPSAIGRPVVVSLEHPIFYLWCTLGALSIPAAALAILGAWGGLRDPARRRATLALLGAAAGMFALFGFAYDWRDNRFVVYWTAPCLLLAGLGATRLPRWAGLPALALAIVWGNLTPPVSGGPPGHAAAIVVTPQQIWAIRYNAEADWTRFVPAERPARLFASRERRWMRRQRRRFANPARDELVFATGRHDVATRAAGHLEPEQTLFLHVGPGEYPTYVYILVNQIALWSRHLTRAVSLGSPGSDTLLADPTTTVVMRASELARLRAQRILPDSAAVLHDGGTWVLVRMGGTPATAPQASRRNSRTMSSSDRVMPQPG